METDIVYQATVKPKKKGIVYYKNIETDNTTKSMYEEFVKELEPRRIS